MDEAWEAAQAGDLAKAARLSRRARDAGSVNPRVLLDHGRILMMCEEWADAEASLRAAIAAAPTYAEAFSALAELQFARRKYVQAVRLQERAVELSPGDRLTAETLRRYRTALDDERDTHAALPPATEVVAAVPDTERTDRFDWDRVGEETTSRGAALLCGILTPEECAAMRDLYGDEACDPEVEWNDESEGCYAYRYLATPVPPLLQTLREEIYSRATRIANDRELLLERQPRHPPSLDQYLQRAAGHRSTARLLRLARGGRLVPRRESRRRAFPFQLLVDLGPGAGGSFALDDRRPGRKLRRHSLPTTEGDGVLHCLQDRLERVAGINGLQPVLWSCSNAATTDRTILQLPFQDE